MVSTETFSKPVWEKHLKQPKHAQNRKSIDLFTFYCHSINPNNNSTWFFFHRWSCTWVFNRQQIQLMLKFNLNHMYFKLFLSSGFLGFTRTEKPENTGKTQNKFDNLLMHRFTNTAAKLRTEFIGKYSDNVTSHESRHIWWRAKVWSWGFREEEILWIQVERQSNRVKENNRIDLQSTLEYILYYAACCIL